jgi:hypothetical protein
MSEEEFKRFLIALNRIRVLFEHVVARKKIRSSI